MPAPDVTPGSTPSARLRQMKGNDKRAACGRGRLCVEQVRPMSTKRVGRARHAPLADRLPTSASVDMAPGKAEAHGGNEIKHDAVLRCSQRGAPGNIQDLGFV